MKERMKVKNRFLKTSVFKTFVLTLIIILACILNITCKPDMSEDSEFVETDVVYSPEQNTVTIYLNGRVSVPRALSRPLAMMGCDYFEVNFLDNAGVLTRAEWMAGKMARISGLTMGISYGNAAAPTGGQGSAVLFAGKTDKTLMATGRLTAVDGSSPPATPITDSTKSVTFRLNAITAAVSDIAANSSFLTDAKAATPSFANVNAANTAVESESVFNTETKAFPCFELERFKTINAIYEFKLSSADAPYNNLNNYGIYVSTPAFTAPGLPVDPPLNPPVNSIERKIPRYTSNGISHESILLQDEKTIVTLANNTTADALFVPGVRFTFNTAETVNGSVFSLVFSIPVYALKALDKDGNRSRWYVRSGYGPNLYDLDDGSSGMGGAVLIRTGHVQEVVSDNIKIKVVTKPTKYQYPISGSGWMNDRVFDITGLRVDLVYDDIPETFIRTLAYDELDFIIGRTEVLARWQTPIPPSPPLSPYSFAQNFWGIIEITVRYTHTSGKIVDTFFYVLVSGGGYNLSNFAKIVHIYDNSASNGTNAAWETANTTGSPNVTGNDATARFSALINNAPAGSSTFVIFHNNFNLTLQTLNQSGNAAPRLFFMVAGEEWNTAGAGSVIPGPSAITIGRGSAGTGAAPYLNVGNSIIHNITSPPGMNGINAYYFGMWPFSGAAPGSNATYPYTINTRNVYSNAAYLYDNKMLTDGFLWNSSPQSDGGIYNVKVGPGVTVRPTVQISVPYQGTIELIDTYPYLH
jgi:hypothetical protein